MKQAKEQGGGLSFRKRMARMASVSHTYLALHDPWVGAARGWR